jgi:hypothetical protein
MRTTVILASAAAIAFPAAAVAGPEEPRPVVAISSAEPVRIADDSFVIRMYVKALQTPTGRARLLLSLQESARRLCADVQPRSEAPACEHGVIALARLHTQPVVGQAIRLAETEQQGTVLASVR